MTAMMLPAETLADFDTVHISGVDVPIVNAFMHGRPTPLIGCTDPEACDHAGATWSSDLELRCPTCGSRLFLPPRFLACKTESEIDQMHSIWHAAGCPPWYPSGWGIVPQYWHIAPIRQFAALGGLPIRNDRLESLREDVLFALADKQAAL